MTFHHTLKDLLKGQPFAWISMRKEHSTLTPGCGRRPMFGRHMHDSLERHISHFFVWQLSVEIFMFNISSSKPISSSSETHSSLQKTKSFEVAPHIKAVSFHFQTLVYGIKYHIARLYQHRPQIA